MIIFTSIGSISCTSLYFFTGDNIYFGLSLIALAVIGWAGSFVYYNSFLPIIATPDQHNKISARGFAWGYMGSMILFIFNIITIETWSFWGFPNKLEALRFSFFLVGFWWIGVAQIAFWNLKEYKGEFKFGSHVLAKGFQEIKKVFSAVIDMKIMRLFLISFFFLSMGVQTVMLVAALFGSAELGIGDTQLIITIFLIQILAVFGSFTFARVSNSLGNFTSLLIMLGIWVIICITAYFVTTANQFYILAGMVGFVMGGIQSQARATYAKLIPEDTIDTASYFSFYDITEKIGIVLGMFSFGFLEHLTGSMRNSVVLLSAYFIISFIILMYALFKKRMNVK
jgi:UMF1 family MFS transporter